MKNAFETYNIIADWFSKNRDQGLMEKVYLDKLIEIAPKGAAILDLGCGTGIPVMAYLLHQGMQVTGVDASYQMLDIAKKNFPFADFVQADMRALSLHQKYHAIIAWHSFFHLPSEDQPAMFDIFKKHLHPNGVLLFTSGTVHGESWGTVAGEQLFHASLDTDHYKTLLAAHHFHILEYREHDPACGHATVWMVQLSESRKASQPDEL